MPKNKGIASTSFVGLVGFKVKISIFLFQFLFLFLVWVNQGIKPFALKLAGRVLSSWTLLKWEWKPKPQVTENLVFLPQTSGMPGLLRLPDQHKAFSSGIPFLSQTSSFEGGYWKIIGQGSILPTMPRFSLGFHGSAPCVPVSELLILELGEDEAPNRAVRPRPAHVGL